MERGPMSQYGQDVYDLLIGVGISREYRKGAASEEKQVGSMRVVEIWNMPPVEEFQTGRIAVDVEFMVIGVDKDLAESRKADFEKLLRAYPEPERLSKGPSYIEVGGVLGDQGLAFHFFAVGKVLGYWDVITPATMGFTGDEARRMAGNGFVMCSGWKAG
jgi:hypothetical protein